MSIDNQILNSIKKLAEKKGVKLIKKEDSKLMQFLQKLMFWNPKAADYTFYFFGKIYYPSYYEKSPSAFATTISHELVHHEDSKKFTSLLYGFLYATPQILSLLALISFFTSWWVLLFLLLAAPLPSYFRMYAEARAYCANFMFAHEIWNSLDDRRIEYSVETYTGSGYYFMWPFKGHLKKYLKKYAEKVKDKSIDKEIPVLGEVRKIIDKHNK